MKTLSKGFTLVELLIVIALLGIIATVVIAAINPIEQANRARDTGFKGDSSQLLSAIERYYTAKQEFPWVTSGLNDDNDSSFGFANAAGSDVGVCGDDGCTLDGELITAMELKTEFRNRNFIKKRAQNTESVFIGKEEGSSGSVYACYHPLSKTNRDNACSNGIAYLLDTESGAKSADDCESGDSWATTGIGDLRVVCVPE